VSARGIVTGRRVGSAAGAGAAFALRAGAAAGISPGTSVTVIWQGGVVSRAALSAVDLSVATSRVYLGVHYPSDVTSGLLMGRAVARLWPRGRS